MSVACQICHEPLSEAHDVAKFACDHRAHLQPCYVELVRLGRTLCPCRQSLAVRDGTVPVDTGLDAVQTQYLQTLEAQQQQLAQQAKHGGLLQRAGNSFMSGVARVLANPMSGDSSGGIYDLPLDPSRLKSEVLRRTPVAQLIERGATPRMLVEARIPPEEWFRAGYSLRDAHELGVSNLALLQQWGFELRHVASAEWRKQQTCVADLVNLYQLNISHLVQLPGFDWDLFADARWTPAELAALGVKLPLLQASGLSADAFTRMRLPLDECASALGLTRPAFDAWFGPEPRYWPYQDYEVGHYLPQAAPQAAQAYPTTPAPQARVLKPLSSRRTGALHL